MYTFNVVMLIRVAENTFNAKFFPVMAEDERDARLEALSDHIRTGGNTEEVAKVKAYQTSSSRISKVPTLVGLQPV